MKRLLLLRVAGGVFALLATFASFAFAQAGAPSGEWPAWGGDDGSTRYSALSAIDATNVDQLEIAWRWKME